MRLLQLELTTGDLTLSKDLTHNIPPYAILSHTWGDEDDEVSLQDIMDKKWKNKAGHEKIVFCGKQAMADGLHHFWVDTCCIDKKSSAELTESIASMFEWYQNAEVCYVYLKDVTRDVTRDESCRNEISQATWQQAFRRSRWFTRGWTLQELIAPGSVRFFDKNYLLLGDKVDLKDQVCEITGIEKATLLGALLAGFKFSERYEWARSRQTTREEDWAYSLQGIFGIFMSPIYGEGRSHAVRRLVTTCVEKVQLHVATQSFVTDDGNAKFVDPVLLDIALLETLAFHDEARIQVERHRSNVRSNDRRLQVNTVLISDAVSVFFGFLGRLLWRAFSPFSSVLMELETQLEINSAILRSIIASDKKIVQNIERDRECSRKTLENLKTATDIFRSPMGDLSQATNPRPATSEEINILKQYIRNERLEIKGLGEGKQNRIADEVKRIIEKDEEGRRLGEQITKLRKEYRDLRQSLELVEERLQAQPAEAIAKVKELEAKLEEAERPGIRRAQVNLAVEGTIVVEDNHQQDA